jgi:MFS family permease
MPNSRNLYIIITLSIGIISGIMSTSMLNLVMNQIATTFNVSFSYGYFRNSVFFISFSSSLLLFGKIVDSFSANKIYNLGILLFCSSCILSIYLKSFPFYLITQGLQGLADTMILSAIMNLIRYLFSENKIGWTFGVFIPIFIPKIETKKKYIDKNTCILYFICFLFLSILQFPIVEKNFNFYKYLSILALIILATIFYFINKRYTISCLRIFLIFLASNLFRMLIPSMLQVIYKFSISTSGIILAIESLFLALISKKCGKYADKIPTTCILLGSSLPILGMLLIKAAESENSIIIILISLIIITLGGAFSFAASNKIAMLSVSKENVGQCMGFFQFLQFSSGSISASFILYISKENGSINKQIWDIIILSTSSIYLVTFIISSVNKKHFIINNKEIKC